MATGRRELWLFLEEIPEEKLYLQLCVRLCEHPAEGH